MTGLSAAFASLHAAGADHGGASMQVWRALRQLFDEKLVEEPLFSSLSLAYAQSLVKEAKYSEAKEVAVAIGLDAGHRIEAAKIIAKCSEEIGGLDAAVEAYTYVFDRDPDDEGNRESLISLLDKSGRTPEAEGIAQTHEKHLCSHISLLKAWHDTSGDRDNYLDLLERVILNIIYEDISRFNGLDSPYNESLRLVGSDKPLVAHSMIGFKRLRQLRRAAECVLDEDIDGDFIETGVWRGGACILLNGVLTARAACGRKIFVADTFCGVPPPDARYAQDAVSIIDFHLVPELSVSQPAVEDNFRKYDLLNDNVVFLPGLFRDTLPTISDRKFAIIRLDGDLYSSTMDALDNLYDGLSKGGFVIIDDYGSVLDTRRAVIDFRSSRNISDEMFSIDADGVFWRKSE